MFHCNLTDSAAKAERNDINAHDDPHNNGNTSALEGSNSALFIGHIAHVQVFPEDGSSRTVSGVSATPGPSSLNPGHPHMVLPVPFPMHRSSKNPPYGHRVCPLAGYCLRDAAMQLCRARFGRPRILLTSAFCLRLSRLQLAACVQSGRRRGDRERSQPQVMDEKGKRGQAGGRRAFTATPFGGGAQPPVCACLRASRQRAQAAAVPSL